MEDALLVGFVLPTNGDVPVMVIGRKMPNQAMEVINAYEGEEAKAIYEKLITREDKKNDTK